MAEITTSQGNDVRPMMPVGRRLWLWWLLASTVGWAVGGPVGVAVGSSGDIIVAGALSLAVGGVLAGVLQWLVLRRQVARAGWWVLASTVGWVASGPVAGVVGAALGADVGWAMLGAVYGTITGPVLVRLLRQPVPAVAAEG